MQEDRQEYFYNIGVSYKKADANTRGKFSLTKENQIALLKLSKEKGFKGVFIISTCIEQRLLVLQSVLVN